MAKHKRKQKRQAFHANRSRRKGKQKASNFKEAKRQARMMSQRAKNCG